MARVPNQDQFNNTSGRVTMWGAAGLLSRPVHKWSAASTAAHRSTPHAAAPLVIADSCLRMQQGLSAWQVDVSKLCRLTCSLADRGHHGEVAPGQRGRAERALRLDQHAPLPAALREHPLHDLQ